MVRLKKPILACAVLLGAAMGLQATPVQACSDYTNYGELNPGLNSLSCTIGDKTFSDFTYNHSSVNAIPVPDSAVSMAIAPSVDGIGFSFTLALTAPAADSTNDISVGYTVSGPDVKDAPEPGFYGVLAGGIGAIIILARRRKKSV